METRTATGIVVGGQSLHSGIRTPEDGVFALFDDAGVLIQATFEMQDKEAPRRRWLYTVPAVSIVMLIELLPEIAEPTPEP